MNFERIKRIHFVGIAGIGMSGIAEVLFNMGYVITGSDLRETAVTERLKSIGVKVFKGHSHSNVGDAQCIVYSSAVPPGNPELLEGKRRGIPVIKRGEMLGELTRLKQSIVVCGSHGKTTTTAMIGTIANELSLDPTLIIGGRLSSIGSSAKLGKSELLIAEGDESDKSFLLLHPSLSVITNIDWEHIDTYPTIDSLKEAYLEFANRVPFYGSVVVCGDDYNIREILPKINRKKVTYGLLPGCEWIAERVNGSYEGEKFVIKRNGVEVSVAEIKQKGTHNILNALAAVATVSEAEIDVEKAVSALSKFEGVDRRFQFKGKKRGIEVFDDYAHHPTELKALLEAARAYAKERRIVILFEPHRFTRLKAFEDMFAKVLQHYDMVVITDVYSAGEVPIAEINGDSLFKRLKELSHNNCHYCKNVNTMAEFVLPLLKENDLVITAGAGTITKVSDNLLQILSEER